MQEFFQFGLRILRRSPFAQRVLLLFGGSAIAQLIGLLIAPLLTRLYSPADFGILGLYISVVAIVSTTAMLRYEAAVPGCRSDEEAANVLATAMVLGAVTSLLMAALVRPARMLLPLRPELSGLVPYLVWIPVGALVAAEYQAASFWAIRRQRYSLISRTRVWQALSSSTVQLSTPLFGLGPVGLLLGQIFGQGGGITALFRSLWREDASLFRAVRWRGMVEAAGRHREFPLFSVPAVFLESVVANGPTLMIVALYGTSVAGWMTLAQRIFLVPSAMISRNIGQVVFGEFAEARVKSPELLRALFRRRVLHLSIFGGAITVPSAALALWLVPRIFGPQWSNAALCYVLLLPLVLASYAVSPFGCVLDVLHRQRLHLLRDAGRFVLFIAAAIVVRAGDFRWEFGVGIFGLMFLLASGWYLFVSWLAVRQERPSAATVIAAASASNAV